jgi:hypothetical protein
VTDAKCPASLTGAAGSRENATAGALGGALDLANWTRHVATAMAVTKRKVIHDRTERTQQRTGEIQTALQRVTEAADAC